MTYIHRFSDHPYAQAYVQEHDDTSCELVSYSTVVVEIDELGWLRVNGLYSMTTIKHIGWFMRERGFNYYTAKQLYKDGMEMNIHTGEMRERG